MKIKSLVGEYVRIKREYIACLVGEYYEVQGTPFDGFFGESSKPSTWVGKVHAHIYGIDILNSKNETDIGSHAPKHQLIIEGFPGSWNYAWDAKYFEVVEKQTRTITEKQTRTITEWTVKTEFNL